MNEQYTEEATQSLQEEETVTLGGDDAAEVEPEETQEVEEAPKEAEAVAEPVKSTEMEAMEKQMSDMKAEMESMRNQDQPQDLADVFNYNPEPVQEAAPEVVPEFGDMYADPEGYQKRQKDYYEGKIAQSAVDAKQAMLDSPEFQAISNTVYTAAHDKAVEAAQAKFGEGFDYAKEATAILGAQQKLPGLTIADAHRVMHFDQVMEENRQLKEGAAQRQDVGGSAPQGGTRFVDKKDTSIKVKVLDSDKAAAARYYGGDIKKAVEARVAHKKRTDEVEK